MASISCKCLKAYRDVPFAHRQPKHDGHCRLIHGHNWGFTFEFACSNLDENGFVLDFGKLKFIRSWLDQFDHALVLCEDDPKLPDFLQLQGIGLARLILVPDASAEGLALLALRQVDLLVRLESKDRAWIHSVTVHEDERNSATATIHA